MTANYDEIRQMLRRWYDGMSTVEEERFLVSFFAGAGELPADLEEERGLFEALGDMSEAEVTLPEAASLEIDAAIAGERHGFRMEWRRYAAACCAVALLAAGVFVWRHLPYDENSRYAESGAMVGALPAVPADTAVSVRIAAVSPVSQSPACNRKQTSSFKRKARRAAVRKSEAVSVSPDAWREHEEKIMMAAGYRVVDSDEEANFVVSAVLGEMDRRMTRESVNYDKIYEKYNVRLNLYDNDIETTGNMLEI